MSFSPNVVSKYFLNLGFYSGRIELGPGLQRQRLAWSLLASPVSGLVHLCLSGLVNGQNNSGENFSDVKILRPVS